MEQVQFQERINSGTSWTRNESFDENGYLVIKNLWNPEEPIPSSSSTKGSI